MRINLSFYTSRRAQHMHHTRYINNGSINTKEGLIWAGINTAKLYLNNSNKWVYYRQVQNFRQGSRVLRHGTLYQKMSRKCLRILWKCMPLTCHLQIMKLEG